MTENPNLEISPPELKKKIDAGQTPILLDVREAQELEISKLEGAVHIPFGELPMRIKEIEPFKNQEVVVICRSGGRSGRTVEFLRLWGFNKAINLTGGLLAWADTVDPKMKKY